MEKPAILVYPEYATDIVNVGMSSMALPAQFETGV
jgi:hypothetical protein